MAQFTRMKLLLFNSEGVRVGMMVQREPFVEYKTKRRVIRYVNNNGAIARNYKSRNGLFSVACNVAATGDDNKRLVFDDYDSDDDGYGSSYSDDGVVDFEGDHLACFRGLVLDISYRPINVVCWKRAICLEFLDKADVLEYYDQTVNSPSGSFNIPAVLRIPHLLQVVRRRRIKRNLGRKNILFRDNYTCQYCSSGENLTIDHVLPVSRGGEWTWENLVTACARCNSRKGQKTLEEAKMKLLKVPKRPKDYDVVAIPLTRAAIESMGMRKGTPEEWRQYLSRESSK